jgi:hypothetical protein
MLGQDALQNRSASNVLIARDICGCLQRLERLVYHSLTSAYSVFTVTFVA